MTQLFIQHTEEEHTTALAQFLPDGEVFTAKNIDDSVYRMLLRGLAGVFVDIETSFFNTADQLYIPTTVELLEEWERTVGIPDSCFSNLAPIPQRQAQVMLKLAGLGVVTADDFIALALWFGITIQIGTGSSAFGSFTYTFDFTLGNSGLASVYTMYVFYDATEGVTFTYRFPFTFGDQMISQLECIFRKLVPACVDVIFVPVIPAPDVPVIYGSFSSGFSSGFLITV